MRLIVHCSWRPNSDTIDTLWRELCVMHGHPESTSPDLDPGPPALVEAQRRLARSTVTVAVEIDLQPDGTFSIVGEARPRSA